MPDHDTSAPTPAPDSTVPETPSTEPGVDLSVLKNLSFGPDWSATPSTDALARKMGNRGMGKPGDRPRGNENGGPPRRDRRPTRAPGAPGAAGFAPGPGDRSGTSAPASDGAGERPRFAPRGPGGPGGSRLPQRDFGRGERRFTPPPFRPTHEVLFYPDDATFRALLKAIRGSCRTYELFEIAQLILQKPERFVMVIKAFPRADGPPPNIFVSQPDHLPFETEDEAIAHVFDKHLAQFLTVEEIEVEPPKGSFVGVSRCGHTGELLAPPNYHLYQQILREHHARRLSRMPFERFTSRIELAKEPEQLAAWLEKMKKSTRYKLVTPAEGAPEFFESLDAARQFLLTRNKEAIVRSLDTVRYSGRSLEQFPQGNIRYSVEGLLAQQRRFPLETANNLRGRLRRMKFNLYKKGSKGVSYVCAVKRKFRDPQTVLAEHVQKLITFIEQHPMVPAAKLPHLFLGLPLPTEKPAAEKASPEPAAASKEPAVEPAAEAAPAEATAANAEVQPVAAAIETAPVAAAAQPETSNPKPETTLTPEQQQQFRELLINLRWLVMEGYVIEYGDGRLFAPPPLPAPKPKAPGEPTPAAGEAAAIEEDLVEETPPPFSSPAEEEAGAGDDEALAEFGDVLHLPPTAETPADSPPESPPPAPAG